MAELKITFTLSDKDVAYLRRIMRRATAAAKTQSEDDIVRRASGMANSVREAKPPKYVIERVEKLETIVQMSQDKEWALPGHVKKKVLGALGYFANPADLIPDQIPGLGFLDDAIMIELVAQDLRHETKAYREFCGFRESAVQRPWTKVGRESLERRLKTKRTRLRQQVREKEEADRERAKAGKSLLRLW
jgi:uncharacterized membrane protein YkvA (DUF1232 family)